MKRFWVYLFLFLAGALVVKHFFFPSGKNKAATGSNKAQPVPAEAVVIRPERLNQSIFATGTVSSNESIDLHPEVSGKLLHIYFREGGDVRKGDLLVKLNDADLQAQLRKLELDKQLAEERLKRNEKLLSMNGISQQEYEELQNAVAGLAADADVVRAQIAKTEITAPFNGRIGLRNVSEGSYVSPATVVASIQEIDPVKVDFSIPEKYAERVRKGDTILFTTGESGKHYKGTIYAVEPRVDETTRTVHIRASCPNEHGTILPGAFARITLELQQLDQVLMVPTESIVPVLKGQQVFVVRGGKAHSVAVETGIRNDTAVQITYGLAPADTVLVSGLMQVRSGVPVKVKIRESTPQ
jgi:membrane fusion protein (multidrug efflux system)